PLTYQLSRPLSIAPVKRVRRQQALHETREVRTRRPAKEVDVIVHEHKSVQVDGAKVQVVGQLRQKSPPVVIAVKDVRSAVATAGDMIDGVGKINARRARHA